ncbi:hypothetical protein [Kamptonema formosum]|uniref:hypothetical protein n=1 Tax=Kamptonema formosum TaxID=331992 RepID=UPI0012DCA2B7|nr:hypothetical protein [Oscillatoria sp. PCC 10802]
MDWIRDSVKEIGSHVSGMFRDDNTGGGNAGQTQGTGSSSSHSGGGSNSSSSHSGGASSYGQSAWSEPFKFDPNTHKLKDLKDLGCQGKAGIYLIRDEQDEHSLYVGKAEATSKDILDRLEGHLITGPKVKGNKGNDGIWERVQRKETLTVRWVECDRANAPVYESVAIAYLLPQYNKQFAHVKSDRYIDFYEKKGMDPWLAIAALCYEETEIAVLLDLPSFWHADYADMVEEAENLAKEAKEQGRRVAAYESNKRIELAKVVLSKYNEKIKDSSAFKETDDTLEAEEEAEEVDSSSETESDQSSNPGNTNSQDSGGSWLGGLISIVVGGMFGFGGDESSKPDGVNSSSEPESDHSSDRGNRNSGDSGGSLFGGWFGTSSESGGNENSKPDGVNSSSEPESDHSSDRGNSNSGDSGGSLLGGLISAIVFGFDSGSNDSSNPDGVGNNSGPDLGSSDNSDSGSSDSGYSGGYDSSSSDSYDSGSSDSGDSGGYDSGSSDSYDSGSSDSGDSGDSDSGSSSDSWW